MNITKLKKIKNPNKKGTFEYEYFELNRNIAINNEKLFKRSKFLETIKKFIGGENAKNSKKSRTIQKNSNKNKKNKCQPDN